MTSRIASCACGAALLLAAGRPSAVFAQGAPPRGRDVLTATFDTRAASESSTADPKGPPMSSDAQMEMSYRPTSGLAQVQVSGSTGLRYSGSLNEVMSIGHNVGGSISRPLGGRTIVRGMGNVGYTPLYSLVARPSVPMETLLADPALLSTTSVDYALAQRGMYSSGASVSLSRNLTSRTSLTFNSSVNRQSFVNEADSSLHNWSAQASLRQKFTRHAGFHASYGRRLGAFSRTPLVTAPGTADPAAGASVSAASATVRTPLVIEDFDIGLDYDGARTFGLGRKATLNFSTGSSLAKSNGNPRFFVTGNAALNYAMRKGGNASLTYQRGVNLIAGFDQPVYTDSLSAQVAQEIAKRFRASASTSYSFGDVGASGAANRYVSQSGSVRVEYLVASRARVFVDYLADRHRLGAAVDVIQTVPRDQFRQTVRAGFSYGLTLIRDEHPRPVRTRTRPERK